MALTKPTQITVPFASSGLKNTIPETATGSNRASMQEGFPAITMQDVDQGGMAPYGQDMNGIIYDVTKAIQYQQAGGFFPYDATFAAAIDGYPIGAIVTSADGTQLFQNTLDGNQSDPENGGANWSNIMTSASLAGKQDKLNQTQMDAVNSGITSAKVAVYDSYASTKQNTLTFDNTPTNGSSNPVTSNGIYAALGTKQDTITVDAVPTSGSANPVQSSGVYDALAGKQNTLTFDSTPTANSTNPVTSDGVKTAVDGKVSKSGDTMTGTLTIKGSVDFGSVQVNTQNVDLSQSKNTSDVYAGFMQNTSDQTNSGKIGQLIAMQSGNDLDLMYRVANPRAGNLPSAGDGVNTGNCWSGIGIHYDYASNKGYAAGSGLTDWGVNDSNSNHLVSTSLATTRRSCIVGNSGTNATSPWYKVGTYVSTNGSAPLSNCLLYVACTDATRQRGGMLNVHMRLLQNHAFDPDNTKLEWLTTYGDLNPNDFVLVCNNDSNSVTFDLYARCNNSYCRYTFKVISEKENSQNTSTPQSVVFNLANNITDGGLASLPSGTQVVSTIDSLGKGSTRPNLPIVLVVAGQSNAVGSTGGTGSAYRSSITVSTGGYWDGTNNAWVSGIADPVWPTNSGSFIPSLCKTLTDRTGRPVYIINVAVSNTVVASQNDEHTADQKWSSNGTLRARALKLINSALATIDVPYELLGTVWLQGESDAAGIYNSHETLADYTTCINDTVQWFQSNIGGRFFCVPIPYDSYTSIDANVDAVNVALLEAVRKVDALVVGSDFTKYARQDGYLRDTYHFTVAGYDLLGYQIARGIAGMLNGIRTGKRITFCQPFKFPQHDAALAAAQALESDYSDAENIWPQGITAFRKGNINYLIVLSYLQGGTGYNNVGIVTVYNRDSQEYLGYYLIPNMRICESIVVKTESGQDYIYVAMQGNVLGKAPVTIGSSYGSTLTATAITVGSGANAHNIPVVWFFAYCNGTWAVDGIANRIASFISRTFTFYDDSFNQTGQFDIQKYENDVWEAYEGLTATEQKRQWSLPRTQGIALGADGIYFMKGGGTNAADTTYRLTDIGVVHYNFQGDLVRSSVCNHTKFVNRMNGLVGVRYANSHSECEGGWIDDDGTVNHFAIINSTTGRLVVTEEFSTAPDAVDFTDCLANYYSNIPFQTNTPQFPRGNDANYFNPFTGDKLTSIDDVLYMCAFWGLDDITISTLGTDWNMTIGSTDISIPGSNPKNGSLHIKRFTNNKFWVTVYDGDGQEVPTTWLVVTDASTYAVSSCTKQRKVDGNTPVSIVSSGTGWRRFSDGTQECWGGGNTSTTPANVNFPKAFSSAPTVTISGETSSVDMQMRFYKAAAVSATGFTPVATNVGATAYSAVTYRYNAKGTWSAS